MDLARLTEESIRSFLQNNEDAQWKELLYHRDRFLRVGQSAQESAAVAVKLLFRRWRGTVPIAEGNSVCLCLWFPHRSVSCLSSSRERLWLRKCSGHGSSAVRDNRFEKKIMFHWSVMNWARSSRYVSPWQDYSQPSISTAWFSASVPVLSWLRDQSNWHSFMATHKLKMTSSIGRLYGSNCLRAWRKEQTSE